MCLKIQVVTHKHTALSFFPLQSEHFKAGIYASVQASGLYLPGKQNRVVSLSVSAAAEPGRVHIQNSNCVGECSTLLLSQCGDATAKTLPGEPSSTLSVAQRDDT